MVNTAKYKTTHYQLIDKNNRRFMLTMLTMILIGDAGIKQKRPAKGRAFCYYQFEIENPTFEILKYVSASYQ
jgi:hypothetical protein